MKRNVLLCVLLVLIFISGCSSTQVVEVATTIEEVTTQEEKTTIKEVAVETTQSLLLENEEQAEGKSYVIDHEAEESLEARENEKQEKAMDITLKEAKKDEVVDSKIKLLEEKYNGLTEDQLLAIDGWLDDNDTLYKNGKYIVFLQETRKVKIMGEQEAKTYFETLFNEGKNYDIVGTSETNKLENEVLEKIKKKQAQVQAEDFSKLVKSHLKEGSGVASIENDMNSYGYTINNLGYVVPTEQAYNYMTTLKGEQRTLYIQTEMEAFKRNNYGKVTVRNDSSIQYSGSQGTFNKNGDICWMCREPNFKTTDALGGTMYAICDNSYEEFREYCGGTTIAFHCWGDKKQDPNETKNWCDTHNCLDAWLGHFIDCSYEWIGGEGERRFRKLY